MRYQTSKIARFLILIGTALLLTFAQAGAQAPEGLLPNPGFTDQWHLAEPVKTFTREDLFTHINGEAELYFPYGFDRLASAFYSKKGGDPQSGLTADIFKMGSLLDAFGIYAQYRKPEAEFLKLGGEGFVNPSQLLYYQDRYFIHLSASGTAHLERSVFESLARAISKALPGPGIQPGELNLIQIPALLPRTERYYPESLLGYAFFPPGLIGLASQGGKKFRVFVLRGTPEKPADKIVDQVVRYCKEAGKTPRVTTDQNGLLFFSLDPLHKGLLLRTKGNFGIGVVDLEEPSQGMPLLNQLLDRLP